MCLNQKIKIYNKLNDPTEQEVQAPGPAPQEDPFHPPWTYSSGAADHDRQGVQEEVELPHEEVCCESLNKYTTVQLY